MPPAEHVLCSCVTHATEMQAKRELVDPPADDDLGKRSSETGELVGGLT